MAKTDYKHRKLLLAGLSTDRPVQTGDGDKTEMRRVKFKAKSLVDLSDDELDLLVKLEKSTGVAHFRDPIREGGEPEEPEVVELPDYAGEDVAIADKTVPQLKAYLDFHSVSYAGNASADTLRTAATTKQAELDGSDKDGGL